MEAKNGGLPGDKDIDWNHLSLEYISLSKQDTTFSSWTMSTDTLVSGKMDEISSLT